MVIKLIIIFIKKIWDNILIILYFININYYKKISFDLKIIIYLIFIIIYILIRKKLVNIHKFFFFFFRITFIWYIYIFCITEIFDKNTSRYITN